MTKSAGSWVRALKPITEVRDDEPMSSAAPIPRDLLSPTRIAIAGGGLLAAFVVAAKSLRDALLCATFGTSELPFVMAGGALSTALLALGAVWVFRKRGPTFGVVALLALNAVALVVEHVASTAAARSTALLVYFHVSAVTAVLVSGFWLVVSERFDAHTLRLIVARIGLGGSVGGLAGGALVEAVAREASPRHALLALAGLSVALALVMRALSGSRAAENAAPRGAWRSRTQTSYVRLLALLVGLTALASSLADFAFKARALEQFATTESLVRFFAVFYVAVNLLGFVVQSALTPRLLEKSDLGIALAGLPAAVGLSGLFALIVPGLPAQTLLRGADASLGMSLFRSAFEPLFTPLPVRVKRSIKALIDVVVDKAGDASGSVLSWVLVLFVPGAAAASASFGVVLFSLIALVITGRLYQRYVQELAASLRADSIVLSDADLRNRTTRLTLSRTLGNMARERLVQEIQRRASEVRPSDPPSLPSSPPAAKATPPARDEDRSHAAELSRAVDDLGSGDPERVARILADPKPELTAFLIPLLGHATLAEGAMAALAALGTRVSGQLADALLDIEHSSPKLRRRLARILSKSESAWSAAGLLSAIDDPDPSVRTEVVQGLEQLRRRGITLPVTRDGLLGATERELARTDLYKGRAPADHALRLLGLHFEPEPFRLAAKALAGSDEKLRGTALEYLENVVPEPVRSALLARLSPVARPRSNHVARELLAELERSLHA